MLTCPASDGRLRVRRIVLFNRLPRDQIAEIAALELSKVASRLSDKELQLHVSEAALGWLAEAGYDPAYGARPVRRAVRDHLLNPLARSLIGYEGGATEGLHVLVDSAAAAGGASSSSSSSTASPSSVLSSIGLGGPLGGGVPTPSSALAANAGLSIRLVDDAALEGALAATEWRQLGLGGRGE